MFDHRPTFVALDSVDHRVNQKKKQAVTMTKAMSGFIFVCSKVPVEWCVVLI
jgi:hypothetical protein